MTEVLLVEAAILNASPKIDEDLRFRRRQIEAPPAGAPRWMIACDRHMGSLAEVDEPPRRLVRVTSFPMDRQTWVVPGWPDRLVWVGQCPDCGAIYHAIR